MVISIILWSILDGIRDSEIKYPFKKDGKTS